MVSGVYQIRNTVTGAVYVGSSKNLRQRWLEHRKKLRGNCNGNRNLQRAWNEHGESAFTFVVLHECPEDALLVDEQAELDIAFAGAAERPVYNLHTSAYSPRGYKSTPETCAKLRAARLGTKASPEARARMSAAHRGRKRSPEAIAATAAKNRGQKRSAECKAKISAVHKGRKHSPEQCAAQSVNMKRVRAERFWSTRKPS